MVTSRKVRGVRNITIKMVTEQESCATIGCQNPAAEVITYTTPGSRDEPLSDQVCTTCGDGYSRRPALKVQAREPLPQLPRDLTYHELQAVPVGTVLHWTYWPGKPSRQVTRVDSPDGNITFEGTTIFAMPAELTWQPRAGLDVRA
jgi:hypothetical protein